MTPETSLSHSLSAIQLIDKLFMPQRQTGARSIPMDFFESESAYLVRALVPGFAKDQVAIEIEGPTLTVSARKEAPAAPDGFSILHSESLPTQLCRIITMPEKIDSDQARASFVDGALELTLPKLAPTKKNVRIE